MWRAAVASPTNRMKRVAASGKLRRGSFWVPNPFEYPPNLNLSAYEPNRMFLNDASGFLDVSYLSGAGSDGDGRGSLVADLNGDLAPDLIVRQAGGGPLRIYLNRMPPARRLTVRLVGRRSNSRGIGARVEVEAGGLRLVRQLFANNNYYAQAAPRVRFGLAGIERADKLTVHWPSGKKTILRDVETNQHLVLREGDGH